MCTCACVYVHVCIHVCVCMCVCGTCEGEEGKERGGKGDIRTLHSTLHATLRFSIFPTIKTCVGLDLPSHPSCSIPSSTASSIGHSSCVPDISSPSKHLS